MKKFWLKCLLLALMTQGLYAADTVNKIPEDPNGRLASVLYDNSGRAIATDSSGRLVSSAIGSSVYVTTGTIFVINLNEITSIVARSTDVTKLNADLYSYLFDVARSTQMVIANQNLLDIYQRLKQVVISSGVITVDNLIKDVIVSSGHIIVDSGTIVNTDTRFAAVSVSSSNSGLITGLTSASIVISDKLYKGSLMFSNVSDVGAYIEITNSIGSGSDYMKDGDSLPIEMYFPTAITFYLKNLPVSSTVQYRFETVK